MATGLCIILINTSEIDSNSGIVRVGSDGRAHVQADHRWFGWVQGGKGQPRVVR